MRRLGDPTDIERKITEIAYQVLTANGFHPQQADHDQAPTALLDSIIELILSSGFGVAIFTEDTPPTTMGNIFFEVGLCELWGKPVHFLQYCKSMKHSAVPSDYKHKRYIFYESSEEDTFRRRFERAVGGMVNYAKRYYEAGQDALFETYPPDYELAFERGRQAVLLANHFEAREQIRALVSDLKSFHRGAIHHLDRLYRNASYFLQQLDNGEITTT